MSDRPTAIDHTGVLAMSDQEKKTAIADLSSEVTGLMAAKANEHGKELVIIEAEGKRYGMGFELPYEQSGMKGKDQLWINQDDGSPLLGYPMKMPGLRLSKVPRVTDPKHLYQRFNLWLSLEEGEATPELDSGPDKGLGKTDAIQLLSELKSLLTQEEVPQQSAV